MKKRYISPLINIEDTVIENMFLANSDTNGVVTGENHGNTSGGGTSDSNQGSIEGEEGDEIISLGKSSWNCWDDDFEDDY